MNYWADKYIGKTWFSESDATVQRSCLMLVIHILEQEKDFKCREEDSKTIHNLTSAWGDETPLLFADNVSKYGEVINDITKLREFDLVILKIEGLIKHIGIMTDNYGSFIHQIKKYPACISRISSRVWQGHFYFGIRLFK